MPRKYSSSAMPTPSVNRSVAGVGYGNTTHDRGQQYCDQGQVEQASFHPFFIDSNQEYVFQGNLFYFAVHKRDNDRGIHKRRLNEP